MHKPLVFFIGFMICSTYIVPCAYAEVEHSTDYVYYDVDPRSYQNLHEAAFAATPIRKDNRSFIGNTNWHINWNYSYTTQSNTCRITKHIVTVKFTITMPRLVYGSAQEQQKFNAYYEKLNVHENNHVEIVMDGARKLDEALARLYSKNCATLLNAIQALGQTHIAAIKQENADYDLRTRHGNTEGVTLRGL